MGESINNVTEPEMEKSTEWDIISSDFPFMGGDLGTSIVGGIIAGIVVAWILALWNTLGSPYIEKKTSNFNSKEKKTLGLHIGALIVVIPLFILGVWFAHYLIYAHVCIGIPEGEENGEFYGHLVNYFIMGTGFVLIGFIGSGWTLREISKLFSSVKSRKGSKSISFSKPPNRSNLQILKNKRSFQRELKYLRHIDKNMTKEKIMDIITLVIGIGIVSYGLHGTLPIICNW